MRATEQLHAVRLRCSSSYTAAQRLRCRSAKLWGLACASLRRVRLQGFAATVPGRIYRDVSLSNYAFRCAVITLSPLFDQSFKM